MTTMATLRKKLTTIDNSLTSQEPRLEDFGVCGITTPRQRLEEYKQQCRGLSKGLQAKFWLSVIEKDAEVAGLLELSSIRKKRRKGGE